MCVFVAYEDLGTQVLAWAQGVEMTAFALPPLGVSLCLVYDTLQTHTLSLMAAVCLYWKLLCLRVLQ